MIEVKNLVKRYGDHTAVNHLSFEIEKADESPPAYSLCQSIEAFFMV